MLSPRNTIAHNERGSASMMIFGALIVIMGAAVFLNQHNKSTRYHLQNVIARMELDAILMSVQGGVRRALVRWPGSECTMPAELSETALARFLRYDNPANIIDFTINGDATNGITQNMTCLVAPEEAKKLKRLRVKVQELVNDKDYLVRKAEVTVEVESKQKAGVISRVAKASRTYQIQPLSLSRFGLMFHSPVTDGGFVELADEKAKLRVFSNVLFGFTETPNWTSLVPAAADRVTFERNNLARFSSVDSAQALSLREFRSSFRFGLQTGVLSQGFVDGYLPNGTKAWNHRYDYAPLYYNMSYQTAEDADAGQPTVSYCGSEAPGVMELYNATRASGNIVPTPTPADMNGPSQLKETCKPGLVPMAYVFMRRNENLTIRMKPGDANFCGLVVADTLTVEIDSDQPYIYGLLGNFLVRKLVIKNLQTIAGDGLSEVRIYNPSDGAVTDGLETMDQTMSQLAIQFRRIGASTARNLYTPIVSRTDLLRPWYPSSVPRTSWERPFLRNCPAPLSGYYSIQPSYPALHDYDAAIFAPYQTNQAGAIYSVEAF